jgi:hypothetical protein
MDDKSGPMRGMLGGTGEPKPTIESTVRFADVKGVDEAKGELEEVVAYLKVRAMARLLLTPTACDSLSPLSHA